MSQSPTTPPQAAGPAPAEEVAAILRKRAPTLYGIIAFKLGKGAIFICLACFAYALADNNLPMEFQSFVHKLGLNPERISYLQVMQRHGGTISESRIEQLGEPVSAVRCEFKVLPPFAFLKLASSHRGALEEKIG